MINSYFYSVCETFIDDIFTKNNQESNDILSFFDINVNKLEDIVTLKTLNNKLFEMAKKDNLLESDLFFVKLFTVAVYYANTKSLENLFEKNILPDKKSEILELIYKYKLRMREIKKKEMVK